jgi:predicted Zn-ribbon and HTH transcriptional regulator
MTTLAMQKRIISKLKETKDKSLLESVFKMLSLSEEAEDVMHLSSLQKASIRKGLKDVAEGKVVSHSKVKKEIAKWLSK